MRVNFYENRCTLRQLRSDVKGENNGLNNGSIIATEVRKDRKRKEKKEKGKRKRKKKTERYEKCINYS